MRPALVIDIETRPDMDLLNDQDYLDELDEDIGENKAIKNTFKQQEWKDNKKEKHIKRMALHPTTGCVVCIGVAEVGSDNVDAMLGVVAFADLKHEAFLLSDFSNLLRDVTAHQVICGHNVRKFDIPFLTARCAINDIELPDWWPFIRDWHNVADTMDILGNDGTLSEWCRAFKIPAPTITGEEVLRLSEKDLRLHCEEDIIATTHIINKIARRFPCLRTSNGKSSLAKGLNV